MSQKADKVIPPIYSDRLSQTVVRNYIKTSWRKGRGETDISSSLLEWHGHGLVSGQEQDDRSKLHGKQDKECHHQTKKTHGLRQGKTQDGIREKLLFQGRIPVRMKKAKRQWLRIWL